MICVVTIGEIRAFAHPWPTDWTKILEGILSEIFVIDIIRDDVLTEYSKLHRYSVKGKALAAKGSRGTNLGHNDLWIAAAANAIGGSVLSTDADFIRLPKRTISVIKVNAENGLNEERLDRV